MVRKKQYIRSKTDYVLRKNHVMTYDGMIFENDKFTISPEDDPYRTGDTMTFSNSNFKFKIRKDPSIQKRINIGRWIRPESGFTDYWTANDCTSSVETTEYRIVPNYNYNSLKTFVCYGSAVELINATIKNIILKYPGGIYYLGSDAQEIIINNQTYYTVANDFEINLLTQPTSFESVDNPMRVLGASYMNYIVPSNSGNTLEQPIVNINGPYCYGNIVGSVHLSTANAWETDLFVYKSDDGELLTLSRSRGNKGEPIIVPNPDSFAEAYAKLDIFSQVLLNLTTKPLFLTKLETPYSSPIGYQYKLENYVFPSLQYNGWFSPYISGNDFNAYYGSLISLANYLDENDTFNIWRMMTHESLKNLDWTTTRMVDDEENSDFDSTRLKIMLTLYGRQFDDIKRYADNIKDTNVVKYSKGNTTPDYFLTDILENNGWDAYMTNPTNDNTLQSDVLYSGTSVCGYTSSEANVLFMKELILNSQYINAMRGTRRSLKTILGMFGFEESDDRSMEPGTYQIHEHIAVARQFPTYQDVRIAFEQADDYGDGDAPFEDLPIALVQLSDYALDLNDSYVIPWFDKNNENTNYMYFQMNGGWEHVPRKNINLDISAVSSITQTEDMQIYNETVPYLKYVATLDELTAMTSSQLTEGMVCYVDDISGMMDDYVPDSVDRDIIEQTSGACFSNYFILKNIELSTFLGFFDAIASDGIYNCYGWRNIFKSEYDGILDVSAVTCDGMKVLYLESLKNSTVGNNPHVGYGNYDDGFEYLEYFNQIFKNKLDNNLFSRLSATNPGITEEDVRNIGFDIDYDLFVDDKKCHYFMCDNENRHPSSTTITSTTTTNGNEPYLEPINDEFGEDTDITPQNWDNYTTFYSALTIPTEEGDDITVVDEPASFSVINVKNMTINFVTNQNVFLRDYIENVILKYLELTIPSTTIFKYTFDGEEDVVVGVGVGHNTSMPSGHGTMQGDGVIINNDQVLGEYDIETENQNN